MAKKHFFTAIILMIIAIFLFTACGDVVKTAYRGLSASADLYETNMEAAGEMYKTGEMSEDTRQSIERAAEKFWKSWHDAQKGLELYVKGKTSIDLGIGELKKMIKAEKEADKWL